MKILSKYALREHLGPLVFALTALTSLLLLNYIAKNIGQLVGKGLPWSVIGEFVGLSIPFTFAMTLPMAVLVSVLYAFSRLAAENEITALKASGIGLARLLVPVLIAAAGLSVFMVAFNDQALPRANHRLRTLMEDIARKKPTFALRPQVINEVSPGKLYLRAGHLDEASDRMREVVIYDLGDPTRRRTIFADSGTMALTPAGDLQLLLYNGSIQEVQKANPAELQRIYYIENRVRVRGVGNTLTRSTNDTYKSEREMSVCEMQHVLADAQRVDAETRQEIRYDLVNAVRVAATGRSARQPPPPGSPGHPFVPPPGLGRVYCDALSRIDPQINAPAQSDAPAPFVLQQHPPSPPSPAPAAAGQAPSAGAAPPSSGGVPQPSLPVGASLAAQAAARAAEADVAVRSLPSSTLVQPAAAAVTLNTLSASVDAAQARMIDNKRTDYTYDVEIHKKFALAVACAVFVLLGAPIALRFPRGGVGLVIGVSFAVFGLYYVGLIAGEPLAQNGTVSPFWAMWCSNVLFAAVGLVLLARVGRAGSTARGGDLGEIRDAIRGWVGRLRPHGRRRAGVAQSSAGPGRATVHPEPIG